MPWTAVLLAGVRDTGHTNAESVAEPVAEYCGVPVKALAEVGGATMIERVLRALEGVKNIGEVWILGDAELLAPVVDAFDLKTPHHWLAPQNSPASSLSRAFDEIPSSSKVLVTTSDHALLRSEWVAEFIDKVDDANDVNDSSSNKPSLGLALTPAQAVHSALPDTKRTVIKFSDLAVCTCNLFAFCGSAARDVSRAWAAEEGRRKSPLRLLARLGWVNALLYVFGLLDMNSAFARLSRRFKVDIAPIIMSHPWLAVDVDTPEDLALCRRLVAEGSAPDVK